MTPPQPPAKPQGSEASQGAAPAERVRTERLVYGGSGLGRAAAGPSDSLKEPAKTLLVPFTLAGELVNVTPASDGKEAALTSVIEASPERVVPGCPHFGVCGGCHLQMASYPEQLRAKSGVLLDALERAGVTNLPAPEIHGSEPWGYRNRIRLRLEEVNGERRFGYTQRGDDRRCLPIVTCPISAPPLWRAAEAMLLVADRNADLTRWLAVTREIEFFVNDDLSRLQITMLCPGSPVLPATSFARGLSALREALPELHGAAAVAASWGPLRLGKTLATFGAKGMTYGVRLPSSGEEERYWITPGGFFQVNRFLLPTLAELVCRGRAGELAWDLFAGVGLFSRLLARRFEQVTAVEAHPGAAAELRSSLVRLGKQHRAEEATTLAFLQRAAVQRERPDLIVLDPPRAGAGEDAAKLLLRIAAPEIVYVSCDPMTLARDLAVLQAKYEVAELHLLDMFPQTYHQEAVVTLRRRA